MATTPTLPVWTLGDRIRKAREHAGLKQSDLAPHVYKSRTTIAGWENGQHAPSPLELRAIATATGVPVDWLETGTSQSTCNRALPLAA